MQCHGRNKGIDWDPCAALGPCPNEAVELICVRSWGAGRWITRPACGECVGFMPKDSLRLSPDEFVAWEVMES